MPLPKPKTDEYEELSCFLKYVILCAAVNPDLCNRLTGLPKPMKAVPGKTPTLTAEIPDGAAVRKALDELFTSFKADPAGAPAAVVKRMKKKNLDAYGVGQIDFYEIQPGGSYVVDQAGRLRVLISQTPKPSAYQIGTIATGSTYINPHTMKDDCGNN